MTEIQTPNVISFAFEQKISEQQYETTTARLSITCAYPDSFDHEALLSEASSLVGNIKSEVYNALGVEWDLTESGLPMRRLRKSVSASSSPAASPAPTAQPSASPQAPAPVAAGNAPAPAPKAAKPRRSKKELDENGFVTDGKQAAWNVAFLCAGQKTDDGKVIVFDNAKKKALGKENGGYAPNAADFNISQAGASLYGLGNERIGLWLSDAPTHIQAGDGSIIEFNAEAMHTACGG